MNEEAITNVKVSDLAERVSADLLYYDRPVTHLRGDFFEGEWKRDEPAVGGDRLSWSDVHGKQWTGMFGATYTVDLEEEPERWTPLLPIRGAGLGDYNGTGTTDRANMEYLLEHYPDTFVTIGYSSHDGQTLALPLSAEIPEDLAERLEGLYSYIEALDEDRVSRLEETLLTENWDSWIRSDFESKVQERLAEVMKLDKYETDMDDYLEAQLKRRGLELRELFDAAMEASNTYPEWETSESCYIGDFDLVARFAVSNLMELEN